jgi:hypothetical protein
MIMDEHKRGRAGGNGGFENLACVNENRVQRALGNVFDADEPSARIEKHDLETLNLIGAVLLAQQVGDAAGIIQQRSLAANLRCHAPREGERAQKSNGLVAAYALDLPQIRQCCTGKVVEGDEFLEQLLGDLDRGCALEARAKQDRDELRSLERVCALLLQPLAGTLAVG